MTGYGCGSFDQGSNQVNIELKSVNSMISLEDKILFKKPTFFSKPIANIKKGRVLIVQKCKPKWCEVKSEKFRGWIETQKIWGYTN